MTNKVQVYLTKEPKLSKALEDSRLSSSKELVRLAKIGYQLMNKDPKEGAYLLYLFDQNSEEAELDTQQDEVKSTPTGFDSLMG
ncbi:hypothetical protein AB4391_01395 [Vibrio lentus]|uniref:Uncharacterized protein n=1 Tax=Vibrio lentus TaxID=136468 RepID=A0A2N7KP34_9VIBR|nr:hypothetical protein [Vibrio lentus]PMM78473.1 hypothetical protein BCT49_00265 [Vibrio lentus]